MRTFVIGVLLLLMVPVLRVEPAGALSCPSGYSVRGINCCRVAGGEVRCRQNPRLPSAMAPRFKDGRVPAPHVTIDDSDLSEAVLAARPELRERPLTEDPDLLDPTDDRCDRPGCDFAELTRIAEEQRGDGGCVKALRAHACAHSPWRDLDLQERLVRLLTLADPFAEAYALDLRVFPCIAAIETRFLEPLSLSELACSMRTSDRGLPQIIRPTFELLVADLGFRSEVVGYGPTVAGTRLAELYDGIGRSVSHQLELMAKVLTVSGLNETRTNYRQAFINYNGSFRALSYGARVDACFACLRERLDPETLTVRGDPMRCLAAAAGSRDLRADFEGFRALCRPAARAAPEP